MPDLSQIATQVTGIPSSGTAQDMPPSSQGAQQAPPVQVAPGPAYGPPPDMGGDVLPDQPSTASAGMAVLAVIAGAAVGGAVYGGYGALGGLFATAGALNAMRATSATDDGSGERGSSMLAALVDFGIVGYLVYHQYRDHGRRAEG